MRAAWRLAIAVAALVGAATSASADLAGAEWIPVAFEKMDAPKESDSFVYFGADGALRAHTGCGAFEGRYEVGMSGFANGLEVGKGLKITLTRREPQDGQTEPVCSEAAAALEEAFIAALGRAHSYARRRADMVLYEASGRPILRVRQTNWD